MDILLCLRVVQVVKKMSVAVTGYMVWLKSVKQVMLRHRTWHLSRDAAFGSIWGGVLHFPPKDLLVRLRWMVIVIVVKYVKEK